MAKETKLGTFLKPLTAEYRKVISGEGTIQLMLFFIIIFLLFLAIITEIYNSSIILDSINLNWNKEF